MSSSDPSLIPRVVSSTINSSSTAARSQDTAATLSPNDGSVTFISKTPNELLHKIFLANSEKYLTLERDGMKELGHGMRTALHNNTDNSQHARAASQACRRWREVTLAASDLWGRVLDTHTMPPLWFEEVLRRSGSAPLTVVSVSTRGPSNDPYSQANIRMLLQPDIINRLEIFHVISEDLMVMAAAKQLSFPLLKRCSLKFPLRANVDSSRQHFCSVQLFGDQAPLLQHLQISGIIPRVSSTFFSTLTSLHIHHTSLSSILILRILQQTPLLQELSLSENATYPWHEPDGPNSGINNLDPGSIPAIHLPHLKRIHAYQQFDACFVEVLSHICPNAVESFDIGAVGAFPGELWDTLMNNAPKFLSSLPSTHAPCLGQNLEHMDFYPAGFEIGPHFISLVQNPMASASVQHSGVQVPQLAMKFAIQLCDDTGTYGAPGDQNDVVKMLKPFWVGFRSIISHCKFFTVRFQEGDYSFDDQDLKVMLTSFATVPVLQLSEMKFLEAILLALSLPPEGGLTLRSGGNVDNSGASLSNPFLPSLQVLGIPRIAITNSSTFAALTQMLTFRKTQNAQIRFLALFPWLPMLNLEQVQTGLNSVDFNEEDNKLCEERVQSLAQDFGIAVAPV